MLDLKGLLSKARLPMDITRRGFLEVSTVAAAVAAMNAARAQTGAQPYIIRSAPKGILIADPSLCVSCQRCELACTEFNDGKADPRLARIKINRGMFYGTEGTSLTSPHNGAYGSDPVCVQDTCRQCDHPVPCANACPKGAIRVNPKTGARYVDEETCIGCGLCQKACPWNMMSFDVEKNVASKCFLCNGDPKCVKACPTEAIRYVPWMDRSKEPTRGVPHGYMPQNNNDQCGICHG